MKVIRGFTLLESITVVAITGILVAILVPVLASGKRAALIQSSVSNLRQLHTNLELYRADAGGSDTSFDSYYGLGLPPAEYARGAYLTKWASIHRSPCGLNKSAFNSSEFSLQGGFIDPVFVLSDPALGPAQSKRFTTYMPEYKANSVMYVDVNCNDADVTLSDPYQMKRGLAVLFSGRLVNKAAKGYASKLKWFSDAPGE